MSHLTDRQIADYLDRALSDVESARVERHLEGCPVCREEVDRLRWASDRLSRDLERAEMPSELAEADVWPESAGTESTGTDSEEPRTEPPSLTGRMLRHPARTAAAAALLLTVAAAGSAAIPGSPLHPLARGLLDRIAGESGSTEAGEAAFGLEVQPVAGRLEVRIVRPSRGTELHLRVVDDSVGGVWSAGGRLRSAPGRIEVREPEDGTVRVELPRSAADARILSDGEEIAVWSGGELRLRAPIRGSMEEGYRIGLTHPRP